MAGFQLNQFYVGDAEKVLRTWPDQAVDCIVTSPPYFQQRDYAGEKLQVGLETKPQEYIDRLINIFAQCQRVLRSSGSLWLVLGDKYQNGAAWHALASGVGVNRCWLDLAERLHLAQA